MTLLPRRSRSVLLALLLAPLALSACKGKHKNSDDDLGDDARDGNGAQDIAVDVSVVSISPSVVPPARATEATLRGAGFTAGAQVFFGPAKAESVSFTNDRTLSVRIPPLPEGTYDVEVVQGTDTSTLRGGLDVRTAGADCRALTVHFDLDSSAISGGDIAALEGNLACYRDTTAKLRVEGHCDERGTTDYNLALGDRRAHAVERWLTARGISGSRVETISYGEERPVDNGHDERAWSANRRVEIVLDR